MFKELFCELQPSQHQSRALCLGARRGEEVVALREMGFDAIGLDLVPFPPYVHQGDIHDLPVWDESVGLVYSNSVDHVLNLKRFAEEILRVLVPGGLAMFHLQINTWSDEVANTLDNSQELVGCFNPFDEYVPGEYIQNAEILCNLQMPPFCGGLNHQLILRKNP